MTMSTYERDQSHEEWMRRRLGEAVQTLADESADKLGRLMGYANGGFIREILKGTKPVGKAIVARMEQVPGAAGWFDAAPSSRQAAEAAKAYKKTKLSPRALSLAERFDALTDPSDAAKAYARLSNILDVYEAEQRERAHLQAPAPAPTAAPRKRARSPAPVR